MVQDNVLRYISRATMVACILVFCYLGVVYNLVFLRALLPATGKDWLVPIWGFMFNVLWILAACSYVRAHCADPGRIPDRWFEFLQREADALNIAVARSEWQPGKVTRCRKCHVARPERAHHCSLCNICVLRMDHHCPWINNCVGFKNYKFFLLLGIYGCVGSLFGLLSSLPDVVTCSWSLGYTAVSTNGRFLQGNYGLAPLPPEEAGGAFDRPSDTTDDPWAPPAISQAPAPPPATPPPATLPPVEALIPSETTSAPPAPACPLQPAEVVLLILFSAMSIMVSSLLAALMVTHLPLACANVTTIEENYDNMPNPFDHGSRLENLAQVMGAAGVDWLVPIAPLKPLSDGVSFLRPDETWPKGWDHMDLMPEELWRLRYCVGPARDKDQSSSLFGTMAAWFTGSDS